MKLVASAIVRNEADRYLDIWLRHLLTFCDEVRLLDDGSTDGTASVARQYAPEVQIAPVRGPAFIQNESAARNELIQWTMRGEPTYVLAIDADEFIGDSTLLRFQLGQEAPVYALTMREVWKVRGAEVGLRVDGLWGDRRCPIMWRSPGVLIGNRWRIPNRRLASGREPQAVRGQRGFDTGVGVYHFGWTREAERKARAERYYEHDGGRFHANQHLRSLLDADDAVTLDWKPWPPSVPGDAAERAARP